MRTTSGLMAGVLVGMMSITGWSQQVSPGMQAPPGGSASLPGMPPGMPPPPPPSEAPPTNGAGEIENVVLPELKFDAVPLDEVIDSLRERVPGFNPVVVRQPGVPNDYPTLRGVNIRNVTLGQFLDFLKTAYPGVEIMGIKGPAGSIHVIRVTPKFDLFSPGMMMPGAPFEGGVATSVYRLTDIIDSLAAAKSQGQQPTAEARKQAMNDVLSLMQAALEQSDKDSPAVLKVHEATQVLLFKGSEQKRAVIEQILKTLETGAPTSEIQEFKSHLKRLELGLIVARDRAEANQKSIEAIMRSLGAKVPQDSQQRIPATQE